MFYLLFDRFIDSIIILKILKDIILFSILCLLPILIGVKCTWVHGSTTIILPKFTLTIDLAHTEGLYVIS